MTQLNLLKSSHSTNQPSNNTIANYLPTLEDLIICWIENTLFRWDVFREWFVPKI